MANKKNSPVGEFLGKKHPEKIKKAVESNDLSRLRPLLQNLAYDIENLHLPQPNPEIADFEGSMELDKAMAEIRKQISGALADIAKLDPKIDAEVKKVERLLQEKSRKKEGPPPPPADEEDDVVSADELEIEEGTDEELIKKFEVQFAQHPETKIMLEVMTGDAKALEARGYRLNEKQLLGLAKEIFSTEAGKVNHLSTDEKTAIIKLIELGFSPNEIEKDGVTFDGLLKKLEAFRGDKTKKDVGEGQEEGSGVLETMEDLVPKIIEDELLNATLNDQSLKQINEIGRRQTNEEKRFEIKSKKELARVVKKTLEEYSETYGTGHLPEDLLDFEEITKWLLKNKTRAAQVIEMSKNLEASLIENQREKNERAGPTTLEPTAEPQKDAKGAKPVEQARKTERTGEPTQLSEKFNRRFVNRLKELDELDLDGLIQKLESERLVKRDDTPETRRNKINGVLTRWKRIRSEVIETLKNAKTRKELEEAVKSVCQLMDGEGVGQLANYAYPGRKKAAGPEVEVSPIPELPPLPKMGTETKTVAPKTSPIIAESPAQPSPKPAPEAPKAPTQTETLEKEWKGLMENADEQQKALYQQVADRTKTSPKEASAFIKAIRILEITATGDPELKKIQNKIRAYVEPLISMPPELSVSSAAMPKALEALAKMDEAMEDSLKQHANQTEQLKKKDFLLYFSMGDLEDVVGPIYEIAEKDASKEQDARKRTFLIQAQKACRVFLEKVDVQRLEKLEPNEAAEEAKKIMEAYNKQLKIHLEKYKAKSGEPKPPDVLKGPEPPAPPVVPPASTPTSPSVATPSLPKIEVQTPSASAAPASSVPSVLKPIPIPKGAPMIITNREKEAGLDKLDQPVATLLNSLLKKKDMVRGDDPVCLAINELIREKGKNVADLKAMLQNPTVFGRKVDEEVVRANAPEGTSKEESLSGLKIKYEGELEKIIDQLEGMRGSRVDVEERRDELSERKRVIKEMLRGLEVLIQIKERTVRYDSPKHILAMILYDLEKDNADFSVDKFYAELDRRIEEQRGKLYSGVRSGINRVGFFLRPTLKSTLKALAEDRELKKIGDKPAEKLAELGKLFSKTPEKVKAWVESLPGGLKAHVFTTVPRLIAYLELAIRDGQVSYMMTTGGAEELVKNLKVIRNKQIQLEVEEEFEKNKTMKNRDLAYMYVMRLNEADRATDDISKKYLKYNALKSAALKVGTVGGAAAIGGLAAFPVLSALPAILSIPTFIASYLKSTPVSEENKPMMRRVAIRAFVANALALGGAALAAPLAIPMGVLGMLSPEIWKHRKYLFEKGTKGGKIAWEKGIKPGVPLVAKGVLGVFKWTVGLPFTLAYKAGRRLAK
jgi:hypothetical protein